MVTGQNFTIKNGIVVADFCACNGASDFHGLVGLKKKSSTLKLNFAKFKNCKKIKRLLNSREMGANWDDKRAELWLTFDSGSRAADFVAGHIVAAAGAAAVMSLV